MADPIQTAEAPKEELNPAELPSRGPIVFYCKSCKKIIAAERVGKKYQYKCPECKSKDIAIGTEQSIRNFYRVI